jgi:hypothetical protein
MVGRAIQESFRGPVAARKYSGMKRGIGGSRGSQSSSRIINYGQNNVLDKERLAQPCTAILYSGILHLDPVPRTEISALQDLLRQLVLSISPKHKVTGRELAITKAHSSPITVTFLQTFSYNCSAQLSTARTWLRQQGRGDETWRSGLRCAIVLCRQNSTEYSWRADVRQLFPRWKVTASPSHRTFV